MGQIIAGAKAVIGVLKVIGAFLGSGTLAAYAVQTVIVFGVSKIMAKRAMKGLSSADGGGRVQLPPATNNVLPVIYGQAYISPVITDAKISADQKFMWYVCSLAEVTDSTASSAYTFGDIYWNGNKVNGISGTSNNVTSWTNNAQQTDSKMAGKIKIYKFPNGSTSGTNTGGLSASAILSDATTGGGIQSNIRWNSPLYTSGGQSPDMTNTCFMIVRVEYNQDADTIGLGTLTVELTNSINKPGDAIKDYMLNARYGAAIPLSRIDTASLTDLNTYSDQLITYTDVNGASATQARYRVNGPLNTTNNCLDNLQELVDTCDSWLQYSDIEDKWKVVINKRYDEAPNAVTTADLYHVKSGYNDTDANLVGGININPIDLNATFNSLQVAYPNKGIRDQTDYQIFDFTEPGTDWYNPALLSPNEPDNKLDVEFPQVNNYIQSAYLGVRRLLQSREDLVVSFQTDYSGIQVEAGDVIRISSVEYGWEGVAFPDGKLFRVSQVQEIKEIDGTLYAKIQAFEYNETIYADNALVDFELSENTGLEDPNIIETPIAPTVTIISEASLSAMRITATTPVAVAPATSGGIVRYIDFNYGTDADPSTHVLYRTQTQSSGNPYPDGTIVVIESNDLPIGNYYWSITARNDRVGVQSPSSAVVNWLGSNITSYYEVTIANVNNTGNLFFTDAGNAYSTANVLPGGNLFITSGAGELAANTYITNVANTTHFTVSGIPIVNLSNTDLIGEFFGIGPGQLGPNSVTSNTIANGAVVEGKIGANAVVFGDIAANSITTYSLTANVITAGQIDAGAVTAGSIDANAVTAGTIDALAVTAGTISAGAVTAGTLDVGAVTAGDISANAVTTGTLDANAVTAGSVQANAITAGTIAANAVTAGTVQANVITTAELVIGAVTQARSTTAPVVFEQVPYYNFATPKTWPDNTRAIYPAGGASIVPSTDPEGSANIEYTEGSRITIGITTQLFSATNPEYNLIEVWKSGASTQFDRGFNIMKHSYFTASGYTGTQTIHAYGYGGLELYSTDGGANWSTAPSGVSATQQTFTGAINRYNSPGTAWTNYNADNFGPSQQYLSAGAFGYGNQEGDTAPQPTSQLRLNENLQLNDGSGTVITPVLSYNNACFAPNTGGNGLARTNSVYDGWAITSNGQLAYNRTRFDAGVVNRYLESSGTLQPLFGIWANDLDAGSQYTVMTCGGTGTMVRSVRDMLSYTPASPPVWTSKPITLTNGNAVLSDLYDVCGDGSAQGSGTWVAVGQFGMIQVSTDDGDTWDQVASPIAQNLNGIAYGNSKWIAVGNAGVILVNSGNPTVAADWVQVQSTLTDRNLFKIDHSPEWTTFNVGGEALILNSSDGTINFSIVSTQGPAETYDLTRLTFFGSHPLVNDVSLPAPEAQIENGGVFSTTIVDTQYVQGQETTYFLVVGNLNGEQISVGQSFLLVQELKR